MTDAGLSNSPAPARRLDATDEQLSAELRKWTGASPALHPVGELLDRHWEAAFAYARLCTDGPRSAGMLTTAAFTRLFGETLRQNGPTSAWRPQIVVTVRRIAAEWDTDHRREMLRPDLRSEAGDGERLAARLLPPPDRRLLSGAFQRLPQSARCLLWHTEVEAEPLAVPAGLLGLDEEGARVELGRARERLREECVELHRELAPDEECGRYARLLDVTCRRGGVDMDPDLRTHLEGCTHCRDAADQLDRFNDELGVALAQAVLGWGARDYVRSRARSRDDGVGPEAMCPEGGEAFPGPAGVVGEAFQEPADAEPTPAPGVTTEAFPDAAGVVGEAFPDAARAAGDAFPAPLAVAAPPPTVAAVGEPFPTVPPGTPDAGTAPPAPPAPPRTGSRAASRRGAQKASRRAARRRNVTVGILTVSGLIALPLVLWSVSGSGDGTPATGGGRPSEAPGSGAGSSTSDPSWVGAGDAPEGALRGRLHNVASGLCVGLAGKKAVEDAVAELTTCSSVAVQQWTYETDGLLRNVADPDLCLDAHLGYSVRLAPCTGTSQPDTKNVRYDFTLQGALVPRWNQDLALAPAATDGSGELVLKTRADDDTQRWVIDTSKPDLQMEVVHWDAADAPAPLPTPPAKPSRKPTPTPSATPTTPQATPTNPYPTPCYPYGFHCSWNGQDGWPGSGGYEGGYGSGGGGYGGGGYAGDGRR